MGGWERQQQMSDAAMLFDSDTVVGALAVMQAVGRNVLPVVGDERGEFLGQVSHRELVLLAQRVPLERLGDVVKARGKVSEAGSDVPHRVRYADPLLQAVSAARLWKQ